MLILHENLISSLESEHFLRLLPDVRIVYDDVVSRAIDMVEEEELHG